MKKALVLLALTVALILCFAACGGQSNNTPEHIHTFGEWENAKNPTCTEAGAAERYCSCGEKQEKELPALGHTIEIIPAVESTCTESGDTEGKKCSTCGEWMVKPEPTHMKAHESETIPEVAPTCAEAGFTESTKCSVCKKVITEPKPVPALGHDLRTVSAKDAECKVYNETTCNRGGCDHYDKVYTGNVDHKFGEWKLVTNYTGSPCGVDKVYERKCADCGAVDTKTDPATGHNYKKTIISEHIYDLNNKVATIGETFYKCQNNGCDSEYREYEHHIYTNKTIAPTCTEQGYTSYTCTCGHSYQDNFVPATGHKYGAAATCTTAQTCTVCSIILYPALGHDWKEATCTDPQTCQRPGCGTTGDPALGHTYSKEWQNDDTYHYHLAICGCRDNNNQPLKSDVTVHTFDSNKRCIVCKFEEQIKLSTPIITNIEYDKVYWKAVDNATKYRITVNSDYTYETASLSAAINNVKYNGQSITEAGYITIEICAIGSGRYTTSDNSPEYTYYYVPETVSDDADAAKRYKIGFGYNLVEDPYLDTKGYASTNSVLNVYKLLTIGEYTESQGTGGDTTGYFYSSIDDFLLKTQIGVEVGSETSCMLIGSLKKQFSVNIGFDYSTHQYVSTYVGEHKVVYNDRRIINFVKDDLKYCISEIFEKDVRRQSNATAGMTDDQLIKYLFDTYGTHVILGVNTGGTYISQYTVATNSKNIAAEIQAGFSMSTGGDSVDSIINKNFNIDANLEASLEWKNSNTEVSFHTYYYGGRGSITNNLTDYTQNQNSWSVDESTATAYGLTKDGAINIGYLIDHIDHSLAEKFNAYIEERTDAEFEALFGQYTEPTALEFTVNVENGINVLKIDLSKYQQTGNMDNVHSNYMINNIMTIYPIMKGKRIDKVVIESSFDVNNQNLIDNFSIKLAKEWNRDVVVEVKNLGVICASSEGLVDRSNVSSVYTIDVQYQGVNVIQDINGNVQFHASNDDKNYKFALGLNKDETLDLTTTHISSIIRMPIATKAGNYQFAGWYDKNGVAVTDNKGYILNDYVISGAITHIHAEYLRVSEGLRYTINDDAASYSVAGIGNCSDTNIIIPATYNGLPVTRIGNKAFYGCTGLTSIVIPDSVETIGEYAFEYCFNLSEITLGESLRAIGYEAFSGCIKIIRKENGVSYVDKWVIDCDTTVSSITLRSNTVGIGYGAFSSCTSLTSIVIPDSVTVIGKDAFRGCTGLTSIVIGDNVTSIGDYAFCGCTGLTSIEIPDSVTSIGGGTFAYCTGLTSIEIGDNVTSIGSSTFSGCSSLESVVIPDSVTSIGSSAFYGCSSLTSVVIGDSVTSIGSSAFYGCSSLTSVVIGDSVTSIGERAFYGCTGLVSIVIPDSVTSIGDDVFYGCTGIIQEENGVSYVDKWVIDCDTTVSSITLRSNTVGIGGSAFLDCTSIMSIVIPDSVTSIGDWAFEGCTSLKIIEIPDSITSIGYGAFFYCTGLTSVVIGDSVTSIGERAFERCNSITSITVDKNNTAYKSIDGNLYTKDGKTLVQYAIGKKNARFTIPDSVTSIVVYAFYGCTGLASIVIPDSVTSIGERAFYGCTNLQNIYYTGSKAEWVEISIGSYGNDYLKNATIHYNYVP